MLPFSLHGVDDVAGDFAAIAKEPIDIGGEVLERRQRGLLQALDGEQGNQADHGADPELAKAAVREAEHVVEEAVAFVPKLVIAASHVLHRRGDVDIVLKELDCQTLVDGVFAGEFQGDAEHVEAEHAHPAGAVGLFQNGAVAKARAAIHHADVVQSEKAALENIVPVAVHLVDPPGEIEE